MAKVELKLVKRYQGRGAKQVATVKALGLKKLSDTVLVERSESIDGMINKVSHLLEITEIKSAAKKPAAKKETAAKKPAAKKEETKS